MSEKQKPIKFINTINGKTIPTVPQMKPLCQEKSKAVDPFESLPLYQKAVLILTGQVDRKLHMTQASKALGLHRRSGERIIKRVSSVILATPANHKKAIKTIVKLAEGKPVGSHEVRVFEHGKIETKVVDNDLPTPMVSLKAASEILDRTEPKIAKTQSLNLNVNIDPVDLSQYALPDRGQSPSVIDVETGSTTDFFDSVKSAETTDFFG
jgi:hypothetical protein